MKFWPTDLQDNLESVVKTLRFMLRTRAEDISATDNLTQKYILGRRVGRIPSSSADVIDGDKLNDFNVTATYAYFLINNAGTAAWRRVAVGSW